MSRPSNITPDSSLMTYINQQDDTPSTLQGLKNMHKAYIDHLELLKRSNSERGQQCHVGRLLKTAKELKDQDFLATLPKLKDKTSLSINIIATSGVAGTSSASVTVNANNVTSTTATRKRRIQESEGVEQDENSTDNSSDLDDIFPPISSEQRPTPTSFRRFVFQAGYDYFRSDLPLQTVQKLNLMANQLVPGSLGEHLDHMSHHLLNNQQSVDTDNALKLSLSRIVFLVGGPILQVFRQCFHDQHQHSVEALLGEKPTLEPGLTDEMSTLFDQVVAQSEGGASAARKFLMKKRLALLEDENEATEEMELLDILDYIVSSLDCQSKNKNKSELTCYRYTAAILNIIFRHQDFDLQDGETAFQATKEARNVNKRLCSDDNDKKGLVGRKMDLIISSVSLEISSSEWRDAGVARAVVEQQQAKNCRTNAAILRKMLQLKMTDTEKEQVHVLGMEWIGNIGFMVAIKSVDDAAVVYRMGDFIRLNSLDCSKDFKETLELFYSYKHHQTKIHFDLHSDSSSSLYQIKI